MSRLKNTGSQTTENKGKGTFLHMKMLTATETGLDCTRVALLFLGRSVDLKTLGELYELGSQSAKNQRSLKIFGQKCSL